jgi:hypothetical protein
MIGMSVLSGTASDGAPAILATGRSDITTIYVSMSGRHPEGRDANYLEWHSLDHRPEQHRLPALRTSFRVVSTPACRAARAASHSRYDATDHLMTYLFTDLGGMPSFNELSIALAQAGRVPHRLPLVERGVYRRDGMVAAPRIKAGADVLPWWPTKGVYVLIERGQAPPGDLVDIAGVGGIMWGGALPLDPPFTTTPNTGLQITYCFLDDDPATTGERLRPALEKRWTGSGIEPLLAAPFHTIVPYEWDRFLP